MRLTFTGLTNIGRKRTGNQDSFLISPELCLFVLADGMGGHAGGELASKIAVETITAFVREGQQSTLPPGELVIQAIQKANATVLQEAKKNQQLTGMGTTVVCLYAPGDTMYIGHVGDSRAYLARQGELWQLTRDHSLVNEKLRAGIISRDQAKHDKARNVITRSVGFEQKVLVDLYEKQMQPGDLYLTCSDGLSGLVENEDILAILTQEQAWGPAAIERASEKLIEQANENGGDDNITNILVRVEE